MERRSWRRSWLWHLLPLALLADAVVAGRGADAETPCPPISPERRALGIDITADAFCGVTLDPNSLSCITLHCRLCQAEPTLDSFAYYPCAPLTSAIVSVSSVFPSAECAAFVSPTETGAGLSAAKDEACATDSMGCISTSCRLCRVSDDTAGLDAFRSCFEFQSAFIAQPQGQETCGMQASASQAELGIDVVTDATCEEGSPGCLGVCRFCKLPESTVTGLNFCPSAIAAAVALENPSTSTDWTGSETETNAVGAPTATSVTPCDVTLPEGQQQVGLDIVTDSSCANASSVALFGCFNPTCRLCKRFDSEYTSDLPGCDATSENATNASTVVEPTCLIPSPPDASELGLFVVTDESCAHDTSSGFGCLSAACRLCKVYDTTLTSSLPFCEDGQVDLDDELNADPTAKFDDEAGSDGDGASLPGHGSGGTNGGVTSLLSASGMIAVVLATALVSTVVMVGIKRLVSRRSQRQMEAAANSEHGGHIAV